MPSPWTCDRRAACAAFGGKISRGAQGGGGVALRERRGERTAAGRRRGPVRRGAAFHAALALRSGGAARETSVLALALIPDTSRSVARGWSRRRPVAAQNPTQWCVAAPRNSAPRELLYAWRTARKAVNTRRSAAMPSAAARNTRSSNAPWRARASRASRGRAGRCGASAAGRRKSTGARACRLQAVTHAAGGSGTRCWPRNTGRSGGALWFNS